MGESSRVRKVGSLLILNMLIFASIFSAIALLPIGGSDSNFEEENFSPLAGSLPISNINSPANNSKHQQLYSIRGTASVPGNKTHIIRVDITVRRFSDFKYWNGFSWNATKTWLGCSGNASWNYNTNSVSWTNGISYHVQSRAADNATNVETPGSGIFFTISSIPSYLSSSITTPSNMSYVRSLPSIIGNASTPSNDTNVTKVEIQIFDVNTNLTWNGFNWNITKTWLLATGKTNWFYSSSSVSWAAGRWYIIRSRATDNKSKVETPSYGNRFLFDNKKPISHISTPKNNTVSAGIIYIWGGVNEPGNSGVSYTDITIQRIDNNQYWKGASWGSTLVWLRTTGTYSFQYNLNNASLWTYNKTYRIRSRATDKASNVESPSYGNLYTYRIVAQKPTSSIDSPYNKSYHNSVNQIKGRGYTNLNYSTLTKVVLLIMRLSDNKYWSGSNWGSSTWLLATGTISWSYNTGSVTWTTNTNYKITSLAYDNRSQNDLHCPVAYFMFDTTRPGSNITHPIHNATLSVLNYINGTAWDTNGSGVEYVEIQLQRLSDNRYWDGYYWNSSLNWIRYYSSSPWSYNTNRVTWTNNTQYHGRSRAIDRAQNIENLNSYVNFTMIFNVPPQKPYSQVTHPYNNGYLNSLKLIKGFAFDYSSTGLNKVEISIRSQTNSKYWSGSSWVGNKVWLTTSILNNSWSYNSNSVTWTSGSVYHIQSRATDNSFNVEIPGSGVTVTFDMSKPTSKIGWPKDNSSLKNLNLINGTASDTGKAGLKHVELFILRTSDNKFWTGGINWSSSIFWLTASGRTIWNYNTAYANWSSNTEYITRSRAIDNANNIEAYYPLHRFNFTKNITRPTTTIQTPSNNSHLNKLDSISGKASITNNLTITKVELTIKRLSDNNYWNGTGWQVVKNWLKTVGTTSWTYVWTYDSSKVKWSNGVSYYLQARLTDSTNTAEIPISFTKFMFDNKPPSISKFQIENDAVYTKSRYFNLSIQATDSESGVYHMSFSTDNKVWLSWRDFEKNTIYHINRTIGDGEKFVYCRIMDRATNYAVANDSIILDTTPPYNLKLSINNGSNITNSTSVILYISAKDDGSGVYKVAISTNNQNWSNWINLSFSTHLHMVPFTLPFGDGVKTVYVKVRDVVGYTTGTVSDSIILNTSVSYNMLDFDSDGVLNNFDAFPNDPSAAVDSDEDGYPDYWNFGKNQFDSTMDLQIDAFPTDPAASVDSDRDNSPDKWNPGMNESDSTTNLHLDAFPNDPAASIDSDGDGYPDSWNPGKSEIDSTENLILDAFPDDPNKFEAEKVPNYEVEDAGDSAILIIIGLVVVVTIIILLSFFVLRNKNQRGGGGQELNDRILEKLKSDILNDKTSDGMEISNEQILYKLNENYEQGNISDYTYHYIRDIINDINP